MMISPVISSPSSLSFFLPRHLFSAPLSSLSSQRKTSRFLSWSDFAFALDVIFVKKSISFLVV